MTDALTQLVLLTYPIWAFLAFAVGLAHLVEYFFVIHDDKQILRWGILFVLWALAFFGGGLLIAQAIGGVVATVIVLALWLFAIPVFAIVAGVKCWRLWRTLRKIERRKPK
jgi:hypothetical protein